MEHRMASSSAKPGRMRLSVLGIAASAVTVLCSGCADRPWLLPPQTAPEARGATAPPLVQPGTLVTDYHGVLVPDPYRSLEDLNAPGTLAWANGQAASTRRTMDALPGRAALLGRIEALDRDQAPIVSGLSITPRGQWFYLKRMPGEPKPKLYVRDHADGAETLLLDPQDWLRATGVPHSINNFAVAPDGTFVAVVVSKADAELGEMLVFDVRTRKQVGDPIRGIWGELPALWQRDSTQLFFARGAGALEPAGQPFGRMVIHAHDLRSATQRPILGWQVPGVVSTRERDWVWLDANSSPDFQLAFASEGVSNNLRIWARPQADLAGRGARLPWKQIVDESAEVRGASIWRHFLFVRTFKGASRYRVLRYDLRRPDAPAVELIAQGTGVIEHIGAAADGLYAVMRTGSLSELIYVPHGTGDTTPQSPRSLALPFAGAVDLLDVEAEVSGAVVALEGWTREKQIVQVRGDLDAPRGRASATVLLPVRAQQVGRDWVSEESSCTSHDGTEVPMSIVYRRGLVRDGSHPTLMNGYGGYGVPEPAYFFRKLEPFLQRGGVYVDVKPRGGGAYGHDWYQAGVGPRKPNTWKDMIACAQALVQRNYTTAAKLAIQGTSMGGVAVGRAVTERPALFGVAIMRVGVLDAVRFIEATSNGPNHELEMGTLNDAAGVRQLLAMSTYHQIQAGQAYPATLLTAGMNDNRGRFQS
jgi:prolyl oligopeptidase